MVKQHVHNWYPRSYIKGALGYLWGRPDFWGFEKHEYYVCIRGGKIKHSLKTGIKTGTTFFAASGVMPEGWLANG